MKNKQNMPSKGGYSDRRPDLLKISPKSLAKRKEARGGRRSYVFLGNCHGKRETHNVDFPFSRQKPPKSTELKTSTKTNPNNSI